MNNALPPSPNITMRARPSTLQRAAIASVFAIWLLHVLWHGWLLPVPDGIFWLVMTLAALPGLPCAIACLRRRPSAAFWAGFAGLFYFCHGVMEAWASPQLKLLGWTEIALALLATLGSSWQGMRARLASKRAARTR